MYQQGWWEWIQGSCGVSKELVVDLRRTKVPSRGVSVEAEDYKYLGDWDWVKNTDALNREGQSCLYFPSTSAGQCSGCSTDKSKPVVFSRTRVLPQNIPNIVTSKGKPTELVLNCKYIGFILDQELSINVHITTWSLTLGWSLGFVFFLEIKSALSHLEPSVLSQGKDSMRPLNSACVFLNLKLFIVCHSSRTFHCKTLFVPSKLYVLTSTVTSL